MTFESFRSVDSRVLVVAPRGRDAGVVAQVLSTKGFATAACESVGALVAALSEGAGMAFVTEEVLAESDLSSLRQWLALQPPWADLPLIVLATKQPGRRAPQAMERLESLGNVVLLERPLNSETLVSAARSALRSRSRQYDARLHVAEQDRIGRENVRLFEAERDARLEAEQASRMKDEFLATLSHELRTPLSAILGWSHVLKQRAGASADQLKGLETIERNARAQTRLVDELLDMSRINAGNLQLDLQPLMPSVVIDAVLLSIGPSADAKQIEIERAIDPHAGPVLADAQRLPQIVWNLLTNAIKFTPVGGRIRVGLSNLANSAGNAGHEVCITVGDSGEGIHADFLPLVFDRFRQADGSITRRHGGLGLGLAIVRHLVNLHGGSVEAHSDGLGHGATFAVRLPVAELAAEAPALDSAPLPQEAVHEAQPVELAGLRIVLVDDEPDGLEMMARILGDRGAAVRCAASADEAMAAVETHRADVLISDIGMPHVDGYELLKRLRTQGHTLPAIALTAFARGEDRKRALTAGYAAHLSKPVEPAVLVECVASLVTSST
jgi:signal transduction histidine kinase